MPWDSPAGLAVRIFSYYLLDSNISIGIELVNQNLGEIMGARQHPDTAKALQRIIDGLPVKDAAILYKLHPTTLWKAWAKWKEEKAKVVSSLP